MAMQVYPDGGAGDLTRFLRTENLAYSSSRHHYGAWMLAQFLVDRHGGVDIFNRLWNESRSTEHPLETYRRIAGLSQDQLNATLAGYAQRQVTFDYSPALRKRPTGSDPLVPAPASHSLLRPFPSLDDLRLLRGRLSFAISRAGPR